MKHTSFYSSRLAPLLFGMLLTCSFASHASSENSSGGAGSRWLPDFLHKGIHFNTSSNGEFKVNIAVSESTQDLVERVADTVDRTMEIVDESLEKGEFNDILNLPEAIQVLENAQKNAVEGITHAGQELIATLETSITSTSHKLALASAYIVVLIAALKVAQNALQADPEKSKRVIPASHQLVGAGLASLFSLVMLHQLAQG